MRHREHQDLTGKRFSRLVVIRELPYRNKYGNIQWLCKCDCGNEIAASTSELNGGYRKTCGCSRPKLYAKNKRLYNVWRGMRTRCENPNSNRYHRYGGRGIKVCDEWHSFSAFLDWSMNNGYDPNAKRGQCTIDRIDLDGDYSPENCRWVDNATQSLQTSTNHYVEIDGELMCISEAARKKGISIHTVRSRLKYGWRIEDALSIPPSRSANNKWNSFKRLNLVDDA